MKKLLVIPLMLITLLGSAQDDRFTLSVNTEPYAYSDGFNVGAAIEYQMRIMYFKAQVFYFPQLNGVDYFDYEGTVLGLNLRTTPFDEDRLYTGLKVGLIRRGGGTHPKIGFEGGYEHYFRNFFVGFEWSYDYRADGRVWEASADMYWQLNGKFKIGISW